jgi:hypothetical protein
LHAANIIVNRTGLEFSVKVVDLYHWGRPTPSHLRDDIWYLARILYDAVGGREHYAKQPRVIKDICLGLRRSLIVKRFRTARALREHLESLDWIDPRGRITRMSDVSKVRLTVWSDVL